MKKPLNRIEHSSRDPKPQAPSPKPSAKKPEGWHGWDDYAPFYDWENAQTLGRRDIPFWQRLAASVDGPILELGCGTGRVTFPLARDGARIIGIDRSQAMLARAAARQRRMRKKSSVRLVRGDIRHLPFPDRSFPLVMAPYGILQSLLRERDLAATLEAVSRVLKRGAVFGLELVADLPSWDEYKKRVSLRGKRAGGARVSLIESVRQDRAKRLTIFEQEFVETHSTRSARSGQPRRGQRSRRTFTLTFRTLSVAQMVKRLEKAGFEVSALLGDYQGGPWDPRAEVWIILARRHRS